VPLCNGLEALYDPDVGMEAGAAGFVSVPVRRHAIFAALVALRPHQWTKNLLVFAGIVFAVQIDDPVRWLQATACFVAYCAASSAAYLFNDIRDRDADRAHPVKRARPIASGELSVRAASWMAVALLVVAIAAIAPLGLASAGLLALFVALQTSYTLALKHVVLVDVLVIAGLFVIRAAAGAEAVRVLLSPWLLLCTGLLALFLALGKRRGELVLVERQVTPGRRVLDGYTVASVDQFITTTAAATIVAYALYTFTASVSNSLMITIPYVVFGVFRYMLLINRGHGGEEPEHVLVTDRPILAAMCAWVVTCVVVLALD
jgi:4-hydroxybenzoate polyprenyltransferase